MIPNVNDLLAQLVGKDVVVHFTGTTAAQAPRTYRLLAINERWVALKDTQGGAFTFLPASGSGYFIQYQGQIEGVRAA